MHRGKPLYVLKKMSTYHCTFGRIHPFVIPPLTDQLEVGQAESGRIKDAHHLAMTNLLFYNLHRSSAHSLWSKRLMIFTTHHCLDLLHHWPQGHVNGTSHTCTAAYQGLGGLRKYCHDFFTAVHEPFHALQVFMRHGESWLPYFLGTE